MYVKYDGVLLQLYDDHYRIYYSTYWDKTCHKMNDLSDTFQEELRVSPPLPTLYLTLRGIPLCEL